jgi:hypothetical protein
MDSKAHPAMTIDAADFFGFPGELGSITQSDDSPLWASALPPCIEQPPSHTRYQRTNEDIIIAQSVCRLLE